MNLNLGQSTWNRFLGGEMGLWLGLFKVLRNEKRRYSTRRNRNQIHQVGNTNGFTSEIKLGGVKLGVNTSVEGRLYIEIQDETPGAGQATINFYKATGRGGSDKVASANGNDNTTLTINPQNSSGIVATMDGVLVSTVKIGVVTANENNDAHYIEIFPDWGLRASSIWDGTANEDTDSYKAFADTLPILEALVDQQIATLSAAFGKWFTNRAKILMQSGQTTPVDANTSVDGGVVTTSYKGVLPDINRNMVDDVTPQKVLKNVLATSGAIFASTNKGSGSASTPSLTEFSTVGTLAASCSDGSTIAQQLFDLSITDPDGNTIRGRNQLQVGKTYSDPDLGIFGLLLSPTYSTAGSANDFATAADWTFAGQSSSNTNDGVLYFKVVAGTVDPAKFAIEIYRSSSYDSGQLVAKTDEGAANAVVALKQRNGSGLSGTGKIGSAPTAAHTTSFNLNPFRPSDGVGGLPDTFTIAITKTSSGEFQVGLAALLDYYLTSGASGTQTIDENYVKRGTFPSFDVLE